MSYPMTDQPQPGTGQPGMYPPPGQPGMYPPPGQPGMYPPPGQNPQYQPAPGGGAPQQWMPRPEIAGCPPGLEYLTQIDQVLVHQTVQLLDAFTAFDCKNKFQVKNAMGQQIFYAAEESAFCMRQICGSHRGFAMHMADNMGNEVMRATREFKCCAGCCWFACADCCAYEMTVEAPIGTIIGYVKQSCSPWKPRFVVMDENHDAILKLNGPICICECPCCDVDFTLSTLDGDEIGKVTKQWSGLIKEMFTESDNFGINFPMDLDVKVKGTLVAAVFLINMMYFSDDKNNNNN